MRREFLIQLKSDFFKIPTRFYIEATCKRSENFCSEYNLYLSGKTASRFVDEIIFVASKKF